MQVCILAFSGLALLGCITCECKHTHSTSVNMANQSEFSSTVLLMEQREFIFTPIFIYKLHFNGSCQCIYLNSIIIIDTVMQY